MSESRAIRVLVSAGGTREPIDDVRVVTNLSTGRFGLALAQAFLNMGAEVTLLGHEGLSRRWQSGQLDRRLKFQRFDAFADLSGQLQRACEDPETRPDILLMAAAVSDYSPVRASGKISSKAETMSVAFERNPKILSRLRDWCGLETVLVGFKLLSNVSTARLVEVARAQLQSAKLQFTVANDLRELGGSDHPVTLVQEQGEQRMEGARAQVAAALAERIYQHPLLAARRQSLQRQPQLEALGLSPVGEGQALASWVLTMFPDHWQVMQAKGALLRPDIVIDTVAELSTTLGRAFQRGRLDYQGFSLKLGEASYLIAPHVHLLSLEFKARTHISSESRAVFHGSQWLGTLTGSRFEGFKDAAERLMDELFAYFDEQQRVLELPKTEDWRQFLVARGYLLEEREDGYRATPPSLRTDAREAASVCLFNPMSQELLLGYRKVDPWQSYWSFPGGSRDPGETLLAAACRELYEETGVAAPTTEPVSSFDVCVAWGHLGETLYRVRNFQYYCWTRPQPEESDELRGQWLRLADLEGLQPVAAGTRRILWWVQSLFGEG